MTEPVSSSNPASGTNPSPASQTTSRPPTTPSVEPPTRPQRSYMWVAPVVSFTVLLGFFIMLSVLLWEQTYAASRPNPVATSAQDNSGSTPAGAKTNTASSSLSNPASASAGTSAVPTLGVQATAATVPASGPVNGLLNVLFTLLGALGAAFTQVVNFWLGSSKGSSDKTDLLASQTQAST